MKLSMMVGCGLVVLSTPAAAQQACEFEVEVQCEAAELSGPVALVSGRLKLIGASQYYGALELTTLQADDPATRQTQTVHVAGPVSAHNAVLWNDADVGLILGTGSGRTSEVRWGAYTYSTRCAGPQFIAATPTGTDLTQVVQSASFEPQANGTYAFKFRVINYGDVAFAFDPDAELIQLNRTKAFRASGFFHPDDGTRMTSIPAGESVLAAVQLTAADFQRCSTVAVQLDPDHLLQTSTANPFSDDHMIYSTPCLTWTTRLTAEALGSLDVLNSIPPPGGTMPDLRSYLHQISIREFVSSMYVVRPDGEVCSHCHNYAARAPGWDANPYHPPVNKDWISMPMFEPSMDMGEGRTWDTIRDGQGLALQFLGAPKPAYLKKIIERWIRDGMRSGDGLPPLRE